MDYWLWKFSREVEASTEASREWRGDVERELQKYVDDSKAEVALSLQWGPYRSVRRFHAGAGEQVGIRSVAGTWRVRYSNGLGQTDSGYLAASIRYSRKSRRDRFVVELDYLERLEGYVRAIKPIEQVFRDAACAQARWKTELSDGICHAIDGPPVAVKVTSGRLVGPVVLLTTFDSGFESTEVAVHGEYEAVPNRAKSSEFLLAGRYEAKLVMRRRSVRDVGRLELQAGTLAIVDADEAEREQADQQYARELDARDRAIQLEGPTPTPSSMGLVPTTNEKCPKCRAPLTYWIGRHGPYWSCSSYRKTKCKGSRPYFGGV